ncbi:MAG TPA: cohesin domain-containing protein [Saprospiraceae bacterium]|nr:cohesin domain-containing protein [Saprospiraceae bacterium]HMP26190.1 cohesin domain-containing protein [Saprospiraceae bacterium]
MKKIFTHFKSILLMAMALLSIAIPARTQTTIFLFEFENTEAVTIDNAVGTPTFSIVGTLTTASYFGGVLANCTTTGGNARSHAGWDTGDAYRFTVNTTGYSSLNFSSCIRSSNTGVNNFIIRASTDAMSWTTIVSEFVPGTSFASRGGALPASFNNQSTVYIEVYKTDNAGAAGNNIRIDNALLTGTPLCSITGISVSNISACDGKNTHDTSDDTFTADVTVTFANPPNTGNLVLSGDGSASIAVDSLSTATSHTFVGVTLPADGGAIGLTATFSADMPCTFTNNNAGTAPAACSPTCNDGIQNGDETGVDCGGATCPACPLPVRPILECVRLNNDSSYTAVFGYRNENAGTVVIPVGVNNGLNPNTQNGLLPTTFLPDRQVAAFEIPFDGNNLTWTLRGPDGISRTVTANANSLACPPDCPSLMANIGDACDDGDPNTENDMVNSNCECEGTPVSANAINLNLSANKDTTVCGDTVTVAVTISDYTNLGGLSFSINFDTAALEYIGYEEIALDGENPVVGEPGVGLVPLNALTYSWLSSALSGSSDTSAQTTILRIQFLMRISTGATTVGIFDNPTDIEATDGITFDEIPVNVGPAVVINGSAPAPPTCPADFTICANGNVVDLTTLMPGASPAGGTFTGNGVSNNNFNPATAGANTHIITYTYINAQGCQSSCEFEITVTAPLTAEIMLDTAIVCSGDQLELNGNPMGGSGNYIHTWMGSSVDTLLNATNIVNPVFSSDVVGNRMLTYMVSDSVTNCTAQAQIIVQVIACEAEVSIEDPCSCKNNATTLEDGQFDDFVEIVGPSGQTWTVTQVIGFFNVNSPAPPAAPTDDLLGATFSESDNGDGTSTYRLDGIHVDGIGFSLTASNGSIERSVSNLCYYPNPEITGLDAIYCEDEPAVLLTGTVDRGDGQTAATPVFAGFDILSGQMVVQQNAQSFNPQMLGAGLYTVRYTVQAADEGSTEVSPNMFVGFPGCVQAVTQSVQVDPQVVINPLQPQTICSTKRLNLADVFNGIEYDGDATNLVYTWALLEANADGTLNDTDPTDPTAGTYTPGAEDILRGSVTLVLTVDNPDDACEPVSAQVRITIQRVDCGQFPWRGNE